jgi:uncharacterized protein with von Willebrand factor type A (vWA) domain
MFDFIKNTVSNAVNIGSIIPQIGIKSIKYFVDSQIRDKVVPVEGSVLYCDLWVGAEHSGIYVGNNTIADIVVDSFMKGTVKASTPRTFVDQTVLGNKIYVSCNDNTLTQSTDNLNALSDKMKNNPAIQALVKKMGRNYISEERKKAIKVPRMNQNEVYGTHNSDDIMRLLPNELLNLEDEVLETLFYARLLEKNLLTYQLKGIHWSDDETTEPIELRTGPIIACIDTSGSMSGEPLNTAKALLLSIANTLKQEKRDLHLILFGASGQMKEFSTQTGDDAFKLLDFLGQGFNGGTDFETPLKRAIQIIEEANNINNDNNGNNDNNKNKNKNSYKKADVLMFSDGDCVISDSFKQTLTLKKKTLNCRVYSVLCAGQRTIDQFSDEIVVCH